MKRTRLILLVIAVILIIMTGFFVFTVRMSSPTQMSLNIPKEKDTSTYANSFPRLNLVLQKNDMIFYYYNNDIQNGRSTSYQDIRNVITEGINKYPKDSLLIAIKPSEGATYKNTVTILDEMSMNDIKNYRVVDLSSSEKGLLAKIE